MATHVLAPAVIVRPPIAVAPTLRTLGRAITTMAVPAIEKIADELKGDAFHVLISTLLSAQTRDPVTLAASMRLFDVAGTPQAVARLQVAARLATEHGSTALLARCRRDLAARGVPAFGVPAGPGADANAARTPRS